MTFIRRILNFVLPILAVVAGIWLVQSWSEGHGSGQLVVAGGTLLTAGMTWIWSDYFSGE
jgi:hypothetical protein